MKQKSRNRSVTDLSEQNLSKCCPAGQQQCNCENIFRTVEFKDVRLDVGDKIYQPKEKAHRIIFLIDGSLNVVSKDKQNYSIDAGECLFLVRGNIDIVVASSDAKMIVLDTNSNVLFCKHNVLNDLANSDVSFCDDGNVLLIMPNLSLFLNGLMLSSAEMNIPCYHLIKERELILVMWYSYNSMQLKSFFKKALPPRDDFKSFVLNSYAKINTMQEFANLSNMSLCTFRRIFEKTFKETYLSWRMKQKGIDIVDSIKDGVVSNTELMDLFGFKSYAVFYRFCMKNLNDNPTNLKAKYFPNN